VNYYSVTLNNKEKMLIKSKHCLSPKEINIYCLGNAQNIIMYSEDKALTENMKDVFSVVEIGNEIAYLLERV